MQTHRPIERALISTSDKTGLVEFVKQLVKQGIEILATGGTAELLKKNDISVVDVAGYTGFPEIMDGRVKTLHPKIHGGLLGRRGTDDDVMDSHQIKPIDLLVVNLYPFEQTIAKPDCQFAEAIENIDIGGPTMLRSAAKNFADVTVVIDPSDYAKVLTEIQTGGITQLETRRHLAQKVFQQLAHYNQAIATYLQNEAATENERFPTTFTPRFSKQADLRYGENPHQQAALYHSDNAQPGTLAAAKQLQGKPLSFNNMIDSDCALRCVQDLNENLPGCCIVKHATPCGVGQGSSTLAAYEKAYATDPQSAFGGIIAFNTTLDASTAEKITAQQFVEVLLAPAVTPEALTILASKKNMRVLIVDAPLSSQQPALHLHSISGGLLVQEEDHGHIAIDDLKVVTTRQPTATELNDLYFAWQVVKFVKSNAILFAKDHATLGIGTGQTSRVFASEIAALRANMADLPLAGSVMASDAFFPFADGLEIAAKNGITAVIQPGGSKRDNEVIAAANAANMAMVFTGMRHFRH